MIVIGGCGRQKWRAGLKPLGVCAVCMVLMVLLWGLMVRYQHAPEFPDPQLERAVREKLEQPAGPLRQTDLLQITHLDLSGRRIERLDGLERFTRLAVLNLDSNQVADLSPLQDMRHLVELSAPGNRIADLEPLACLPRLRTLNLRGNRVVDLSPLSRCTELRSLDLRENHVFDVEPLADLPLLYLNLHSNRHIRSVAPLGRIAGLETLILRNVPVNGELGSLSGLAGLRRLNLRNTGIFDVDALVALFDAGGFSGESGQETELDLRENPGLDLQSLHDKIGPSWAAVSHRRPFFLDETVWELELSAQTVVLNEVMTSNGETIPDADGDFPDWIELHNQSSEAVSLAGWGLSDRKNDPFRWVFPDRSIQPGEYLIVFASGKNRRGASGELHANFRLPRSGGELVLISPDKQIQDWKRFGTIPRDVSYGRNPENQKVWGYFPSPTPGGSNALPMAGRVLPPPVFSHQGGFYEEAFDLRIEHPDPEAVLLYTLDGSDPDPSRIGSNSPVRRTYVYDGPIRIRSREGDPNVFSNIPTTKLLFYWFPQWQPPAGDVFKATVVRARAVHPSHIPSRTVTQTYFCDPEIHDRYRTLPVISLVSDYQNLFCPETGIYVPGHGAEDIRDQNFFQGWSRPAHVEFFDVDRGSGFQTDLEIRIQGFTSQSAPQKGLHLIARSALGEDRIRYPLFHGTDFRAATIDEFKRVILRAWGTTRTWPVRFACAFNQTLVAHTDQDIQAYRPAVLFINGEFWGLHEIRDFNKSRWYTEAHHGIDPDDPGVDLVDQFDRIKEGDDAHWQELWEFLRAHPGLDDAALSVVGTKMDLENFILYMVHSIYTGKRDWPWQNEAKWRPRKPGGRWRWLQFDMDLGFNEWSVPEFDMLSRAIEAHELLRFLLRNPTFRYRFIQTYADWMNTGFSMERQLALLDSMALELAPYVEENSRRWPELAGWEEDLEEGRAVIRRRGDIRREQLAAHFLLGNPADVLVRWTPEQGAVQLNSIDLSEWSDRTEEQAELQWRGLYFTELEITVEARPTPGWRFEEWIVEFPSNGADSAPLQEIRFRRRVLTLFPHPGMRIRPVFVME